MLGGSDQLKRLLRLVVERTLSGQSDLLKEYNLGLEVFQRPADYDPKVDPIVRVQARRLRSKLEEYYAAEGGHESLVIQIPKGAYVPVFEARKPAAPVPDNEPIRRRMWLAAAGVAAVVVILALVWRANESPSTPRGIQAGVAVLPLKMFTEGNSRRYIADQVAEVLTTELATNKQMRVLSRTTASKYRETTSSLPELAKALGVRWVVEGGVGLEGTRAYVKLRVVDSLSDRKAWADSFDFELSELVPVTTRAASSIAAAIEAERQSSQR